MNAGTLVIFSGLSGSGKSTLAARLASHTGATWLRIDTIEQALRELCGMTEIDGRGYALAGRIAEENLRLGHWVIADSVNPWQLTRDAWNGVAEGAGARFINVEIVCSDRREHRQRVEQRVSSVPGLTLPSWSEVAARDYHPWLGERLVLETSGKDVETSFRELLTLLHR